jgi:hypothetical protein
MDQAFVATTKVQLSKRDQGETGSLESQKTPTKSMFKKPSRLSLPAQKINLKESSIQKESPRKMKPAWNDSVIPLVEKSRTKLKPSNITPFKTNGPVHQLRGITKDVREAAVAAGIRI